MAADPSAAPSGDLSPRDLVEAMLRRHHLRPDKRLGQNFLVDSGALARILAAADLTGEEVVLEVGAGLGTLTQQLARRARRGVAGGNDPPPAPPPRGGFLGGGRV